MIESSFSRLTEFGRQTRFAERPESE